MAPNPQRPLQAKVRTTPVSGLTTTRYTLFSIPSIYLPHFPANRLLANSGASETFFSSPRGD